MKYIYQFFVDILFGVCRKGKQITCGALRILSGSLAFVIALIWHFSPAKASVAYEKGAKFNPMETLAILVVALAITASSIYMYHSIDTAKPKRMERTEKLEATGRVWGKIFGNK